MMKLEHTQATQFVLYIGNFPFMFDVALLIAGLIWICLILFYFIKLAKYER